MSNTTIRVQFGTSSDSAAADGHLSAELDSRTDGLNGGKTSFAPGATAYFLVYKSDNVTITDVIASAGTVSQTSTATVQKTEEIQFEDTDSATIDVPAASGITSTTWFGRSLGSLSLQSDKTTVKASSKGVAVASVTYDATALVYAITSPASIAGITDYSIIVLVQGGPA